MSSERAAVLTGEDDGDAGLDYFDDEDEIEAFSEAQLGCEDGGRRVFLLCIGTRSGGLLHRADRKETVWVQLTPQSVPQTSFSGV